MPEVKKILLVCTGNSCRSVMAAGLLKEQLKGKQDYQVITAGSSAIAGMSPTPEAIQVMSEENIDVSGHRSRALTSEMVEEAKLILVMGKKHKEEVLRLKSEAKNKTYLLSEYGKPKEDPLLGLDIPDPIGRPLKFYREVLELIRENIVRTVKKLEAE